MSLFIYLFFEKNVQIIKKIILEETVQADKLYRVRMNSVHQGLRQWNQKLSIITVSRLKLSSYSSLNKQHNFI